MTVKLVHQENIDLEVVLLQQEIDLLATIEERLQQQQHHLKAQLISEFVQQDTIVLKELEIQFSARQESLIQVLKVHRVLHVKHAQQDHIAHSQTCQLLKVNVQSVTIAPQEQM